jgi:NAD(P)-dependent dehydrogenase (short-subunit alcohol dehydrogenase family)
MASRFVDPEDARRVAEHRYDFGKRSLAGRVVLLPGGAGGLGAATTALLLQDAALPVVGYRSNRGHALLFQQKIQDLYGGLVTLVEGDILDPQTRERYLDVAQSVKGEIHGLVAFPGDPARVAAKDLDGAALEASYRANFEAPFLLARRCAERMAQKGTRARRAPRLHKGAPYPPSARPAPARKRPRPRVDPRPVAAARPARTRTPPRSTAAALRPGR